jgi:hypothetical protein
MGVRWASQVTTTIVNATLVTTAETVVATTGPINLLIDAALVALYWLVFVTTGAGTGQLTYRIRRGTTTAGTLVNALAWQDAAAASTAYVRGGCYVDSPGSVAEQVYSLTMQQTGATGNGTVGDIFLAAMVL